MLPLLSRISIAKFLKIIAPKTGQIAQKTSFNKQFLGSYRLSVLIFTENKLFHWRFAKVRSYLPLKHLVKVLKFRISCFEVTPLSGCFRQLLLVH